MAEPIKQTIRRRKLAGRVFVGGRLFRRKVSAKQKARPFIVRVKPRAGFQKSEEFYKALSQWPDVLQNNMTALLDGIMQKAAENLVRRTPVLTGAARAGWYLQRPAPFQRFIGNNQPHIRRLEHGWSSQPNRGRMVRSTAKRLPQIANEVARRLVGR